MTTPTCVRCGNAIPESAPGGECPLCLFQLTLDLSQAAAAPRDRGMAIPSAEAIQAHFTDLEILDLIGAGGMGIVYRARQTALGRTVAVKVLAPGRADNPEFLERFLREARSQARLSHPHIVGIFDIEQAGAFAYLVMEHIDGASLRTLLKDGRLSAREALRIVPQICDAIQYAHDRGVIHRDIKPENVLIDRDGNAKIADFGLAKLDEDETFELTDPDVRMGTRQYMAPEQWRTSGQVDHRADIYALGVLFYELLTGECPTVRYHPPSAKAGTDRRFDEVIARTLDSDPSRRYQRADHLKSDVERIAQGHRGPRAGWLAALAVLGLLAAVAPWLWNHRGAQPAAPGTAAQAPAPAAPAPAVPDRAEAAVAGGWSPPENLGPQVNSDSDDGGPAISADGLTLLFHSQRPGGLGETDIWECRRPSTRDPFGPARNLGPEINSTHHDGEPTLSADGRTLVFVSHREPGLGSSDLWMARRDAVDAPWNEPFNLGPHLNTEQNEQRPSLIDHDLGLVFSRGGDQPGLYLARRPSTREPFGAAVRVEPPGSIDRTRLASVAPSGLVLVYDQTQPGDRLWMATRPALDAPFADYRSLGPVVNSQSNDTSPTLSADGNTLYFCSPRPGGLGHFDLWQSRRNPPAP